MFFIGFAWVLAFAYCKPSHRCHSVWDSKQSAELQQLRQQVAELTRRVFHLEQLLRTGQSAVETSASSEAAQTEPLAAAPQQTHTLSNFHELPTAPDFYQPRQYPAPHLQSKVSLETRIGGQWLNRVGIVAVLVGLSYFLKLAIENDWIGPGTRIAIGIVAGVGLILWSERFRKRDFAAFAYSMKALGIGALYLSLWAAFQFYHLLPAAAAFVAMLLVTASSTAMSLRQDSEVLAAFALVGGFLTPVLVSTHQNHEVATALLRSIARSRYGVDSRHARLATAAIRQFCWHDIALRRMGVRLLRRAATRHHSGFRQLLLPALRGSALPGTQAPPPERRYPNVLVVLALLNASFYFAAIYSMLEERHRFELAWLTVAIACPVFVTHQALQLP